MLLLPREQGDRNSVLLHHSIEFPELDRYLHFLRSHKVVIFPLIEGVGAPFAFDGEGHEMENCRLP